MIQPTVAESLADILLEIGRDQAAKHQYTLAVHWLEKAHDVLSSQIPESLSNDADEVRSCILHTMIRILLKERGEKSIPKAWNIVQRLESESENRVAVSLLKLELFNVDPAATQDYYDVLVEVVRQIHLTDTNVKTILHHIHELRRRSTRLTHDVLVLLLTERLLTIGEAAWMEKTLITIIWNFTTSSDLASAPDTLGDLFATMVTTSSLILGTSATHAAQIVSTVLYKSSNRFADSWANFANGFGVDFTAHRSHVRRRRLRSSRPLVSSCFARYLRQVRCNERGKAAKVI